MKTTIKSNIIAYGVAVILILFCIFPIYWMLITSLKTSTEIYKIVPTFWPQKLTLEGYVELFAEKGYIKNVANSILVSMIVAFGSIFISMPAAYAIARIKFKGRKHISKGILISYLMPRTVLFIPLYLLVTQLGLSNSLWGLVLVYPTITIPYATWMMISYFQSIPYDIEEAAIIDGCSRVQAMMKVCFPLAKPGVVSTLIFSYTLCWSEYLYALVIINKAEFKTIPLALADMVVGDVYAWGPLMGGSLIASIPVIILYLAFNRNMVGGMTAGGVKG